MVSNTKNIPKLRFKGFSGEWDKIYLSSIIKVMQSGISRQLKDDDVGYPILRSNNLVDGKIDISNIKYWLKIDDQGVDLKKYILNEGDLLINFINSIAQIGKCAIFLNELKRDTIFTTNLMRITFKDNTNSYFMFNLFTTKLYFDYIQSITKPAVNQASFTTKDLNKFLFSFPSLKEQQKIADFLLTVDKKIQQLKQKQQLLQQYKKGMMQKLFSQQIRFKDENGQDYPEWENNLLKDVLTIGSGRDYKHLGNGNIPVFGTGGYMISVDDYLHEGETVCIGRKGTIDKPMYYNGKIWTVDTLFYTYDFRNVLPFFIYIVFQSINWKLHNEASGVPSLSKSTIEKIKIKMPSLPEQQKIADFLSSIDKKIDAVNEQISQMAQFKQGLLQQLFV